MHLTTKQDMNSISLHSCPLGNDDYTPSSGTLSFDSTTSSASINITIIPDSFVENDEVFRVVLETNKSRVSVSPASAIVTIRNDDSE